MKHVLWVCLAVVVLGACKGEPGNIGPQGPEGPPGPQGPEGPAGTFTGQAILNQTTQQTGANINIAGAAGVSGAGNISSSGASVTGNGTAFTTAISVGDILTVGAQSVVITAVSSNTALTTQPGFNPAVTASLYSVTKPAAVVSDSTGRIGIVVNGLGNVGIGTASPAVGFDARSVTFAAGPIFSAYTTTSVSSQSSVGVKVPFNTVEFDPDSSFNTTSNRFQPTKAGYYRVNATVLVSGTGTAGFTLYLSLYKNGTPIKSHSNLINYAASFQQTMALDQIVYMNGTTNYLEVWFASNGNSIATATGSSATTFSGTFLRN